MHGPYKVQVRETRDGEPLAQFTEEDLRGSGEAALRFYADATPGLVEGALRRGVFTAAELLSPGEEVVVAVLGFDGSGSREREYECRVARARRDEQGRFFSTLGSRFNERHFVGV